MNTQERSDVRSLVNGAMMTAKIIDRHLPQVIIGMDDKNDIEKLRAVLRCTEEVKGLVIPVSKYLRKKGNHEK